MTTTTGRAALTEGTTFEDETIEKIDLVNVDLSGKEFYRCAFRGLNLQGTRWLGTVLEDCTFDVCDLTSFAARGISLRGAHFRESKLLGAVWSDLHSDPNVSFEDCNMRYQSFVSLELRHTKFLRCVLDESTFSRVNLNKSIFKSCSLSKSTFDACILTATDFSTSSGVYFDLAKNKTKGARVPVETAVLIATAMGLVVPDA